MKIRKEKKAEEGMKERKRERERERVGRL